MGLFHQLRLFAIMAWFSKKASTIMISCEMLLLIHILISTVTDQRPFKDMDK